MVSTPITGRRTRGVHVLGCNGSSLADAMLAGAEPLGFAAGDTNLYRYVGNEAIGEVDPTGLDDVTVLPGQPYPGQPTLGGPGGVLKDPALRKKMKELQQQYKGGGPELGIIIVWNSKTGSVGWTTKGVKPRDATAWDSRIPRYRAGSPLEPSTPTKAHPNQVSLILITPRPEACPVQFYGGRITASTVRPSRTHAGGASQKDHLSTINIPIRALDTRARASGQKNRTILPACFPLVR